MKRLLPLLLLPLLFSCQKELSFDSLAMGRLQVNVTNTASGGPLALNTPLSNEFGEPFTLTKYKYYLSNFALVDTAGRAHALPDSYFLLDQADPASLQLSADAPAGRYAALTYIIGVDSVRNVSGAQTGALDPLNDMFWTWNTGYIMAKLEGTSPVSPAPNEAIEYHIGGFEGSESVLRRVVLPFDRVHTLADKGTLTVHLAADVLRWFDGRHGLPIADVPVATMPGPLATQFADNYAQMFSVISVQ